MNFSAGCPCARIARRRARCDRRQRRSLLRLETQLPQAAQEPAVDLVGVRLQQNRQPLQMHAKLIA